MIRTDQEPTVQGSAFFARTFQACRGRAARGDEDGAEFRSFLPKPLHGFRRTVASEFENVQPEFGLVSFLNHHAEPRDELPSRTAPSCCPVVGGHAGRGAEQLRPNQIRNRPIAQPHAQVDGLNRKSPGPFPKFVSDHADGFTQEGCQAALAQLRSPAPDVQQARVYATRCRIPSGLQVPDRSRPPSRFALWRTGVPGRS